MLAHTKRAVPADQDKRAVEEIVAPRQTPNFPRGTKRPGSDNTNDSNLSDTLRYCAKKKCEEEIWKWDTQDSNGEYESRVVGLVKRAKTRNFGEATNQKDILQTSTFRLGRQGLPKADGFDSSSTSSTL